MGTIESATALVSLLSKEKASPVLHALAAHSVPGFKGNAAIVLTADQVVAHPTLGILEKPANKEEAQAFVDSYKVVPTVTTVGAVRATHWPSGATVVKTFLGVVDFDGERMAAGDGEGGGEILRKLEEVKAPVLECAGGLMIENELIRSFIVKVEGGEDSVLGLSRESLVRALKECEERAESGGG